MLRAVLHNSYIVEFIERIREKEVFCFPSVRYIYECVFFIDFANKTFGYVSFSFCSYILRLLLKVFFHVD